MKRTGILLANVCLILLTQGLARPVPRALAASQADPRRAPAVQGIPMERIARVIARGEKLRPRPIRRWSTSATRPFGAPPTPQ